MKRNLVFLVALGLLFSPVFAGDDDYAGFRLKDFSPAGNPAPIWNCNTEKDGPFQMHADLGLETPFEENRDIKIYVYNPNTGEWVHQHTCTNVDSGGKECSFYFHVYWGMSETNEGGYVDLLRAELVDGDDVYSKTFNFYISHRQTNQEEVIFEKIGEFEELFEDLECGQEQFEGAVADTLEFGYTCELDDARDLITTAINEINEVECAGPVDITPISAGTEEEPEAPEEGEPGEEMPVAPPPVAPPEPENEGGLPCGIGFVLLALGAAGFMKRD